MLRLPGILWGGWFFLLAACSGDRPSQDTDPGLEPEADADADADADTTDTGTPNQPPTAPEVVIEPSEPAPSDDLTCSIAVESVDPEDYPVSYRYNWTMEGAPLAVTSPTVEASATGPLQDWACIVTPNDGRDDGPAGEAIVTIGTGCEDTDPKEPNETEGVASDLGTINDCDDSAVTVSGYLNGPTDQDWFRIGAEDSMWCNGESEVTFTSNANVCLFFACNDSSNPYPACQDSSVASWSAEGLSGCCGQSDFRVQTGCSDSSDDLTVWMLVTAPWAVCEPYEVTYHY